MRLDPPSSAGDLSLQRRHLFDGRRGLDLTDPFNELRVHSRRGEQEALTDIAIELT